jgi:hypothetical protein
VEDRVERAASRLAELFERRDWEAVERYLEGFFAATNLIEREATRND